MDTLHASILVGRPSYAYESKQKIVFDLVGHADIS